MDNLNQDEVHQKVINDKFVNTNFEITDIFKKMRCKICENNIFAFAYDDRNYSTQLRTYNLNNVFQHKINITNFMCTNCGNVEQFMNEILYKKIIEAVEK